MTRGDLECVRDEGARREEDQRVEGHARKRVSRMS